MDSLTRLPLLSALVLLFLAAVCQAAPNVTLELLEIDPPGAREVPLLARVHGRIRYETDAPLRIVLVPYRDGQPVQNGIYSSGSPDYPAGSGEAHAWFSFSSAESIDEIRAVAHDGFGHEFATSSFRKNLAWRAGATPTKVSDWVAPLQRSTDELSQSQQPAYGGSGMLVLVLMQLVFACIPLSVAVQIFSLCRLEGSLKAMARISACVMAAVWIFVLATAIAGSHLSPMWLAVVSPLFLLYLMALLLVRSKFHRGYAVEQPLKQP